MNTDPLCPQQHTHPKHNPNRCIFCEYGAAVRTHERAKTLDAARKAVAATFIGWCKDYMNCTDYEHVCGERRNTLAAIDALRKDGND